MPYDNTIVTNKRNAAICFIDSQKLDDGYYGHYMYIPWSDDLFTAKYKSLNPRLTQEEMHELRHRFQRSISASLGFAFPQIVFDVITPDARQIIAASAKAAEASANG